MDDYFSRILQDNRHQRSLISSLSLTDPDISEQSNFTDLELNKMKLLPLELLHRQKI